MANILDYIKWRGDISITASPFNAVDGLILSVLSYIPFEGIVTEKIEKSQKKGILLSEAAKQFSSKTIDAKLIRNEKDIELFQSLSQAPRFANLRLSFYINKTDLEEEKQFSAITISLPDSTSFIAYRGTDLTLVGWKEDFNMSFRCPVPSQTEAVLYLSEVASHVKGKLRLGGHSKGGNLAVYAAAFCDTKIQKRIIEVFNNDGPGFEESVIQKKGYKRVEDRLFAFVPESSIIGMLLEHNEEYIIVHSTVSGGLMQHDPFSWSVEGADFIRKTEVRNSSLFVNKTIKDWVAATTPEQRELFIDALWEIIGSTKATNLTDFTKDWFKHAIAVNRSLKTLDEGTKKMLHETLGLLFSTAGKHFQMLFSAKK
ncbi:MAG TPA: DUF2974 domain-containing protein [Treponemataceae bacterium]|nr:DUF2974 domain-containing protein [Treponemataceae bacterium]